MGNYVFDRQLIGIHIPSITYNKLPTYYLLHFLVSLPGELHESIYIYYMSVDFFFKSDLTI